MQALFPGKEASLQNINFYTVEEGVALVFTIGKKQCAIVINENKIDPRPYIVTNTAIKKSDTHIKLEEKLVEIVFLLDGTVVNYNKIIELPILVNLLSYVYSIFGLEEIYQHLLIADVINALGSEYYSNTESVAPFEALISLIKSASVILGSSSDIGSEIADEELEKIVQNRFSEDTFMQLRELTENVIKQKWGEELWSKFMSEFKISIAVAKIMIASQKNFINEEGHIWLKIQPDLSKTFSIFLRSMIQTALNSLQSDITPEVQDIAYLISRFGKQYDLLSLIFAAMIVGPINLDFTLTE